MAAKAQEVRPRALSAAAELSLFLSLVGSFALVRKRVMFVIPPSCERQSIGRAASSQLDIEACRRRIQNAGLKVAWIAV